MCMKKAFAGQENFITVIKKNYYYVDKTTIIKDIVNEMDSNVSLITRPRRFGKTLTLSMLREFFDITKKNEDIFSHLAIGKDKEICDNWMNKYPVIFLPMKDIKAETFEECFDAFGQLAATVCMQHEYLLTSPKVSKLLKDRLQATYDRIAKKSDLKLTLQTLCYALYQHWGKPVIVLIDEYDAPLSEIKKGYDHDKLIAFIGNLLEIGLKTNDTLEFALMTGCLRIAKESIYTGLNHVSCYDVDEDLFADKFGFTPEEVHKMLCDMHLTDKEEEIRTWYDGYCFGTNQEIYCPWDVMKHISALRKKHESKPQAYWLNTSDNVDVHDLIIRADLDIDEEITTLIQGGSIRAKIKNTLTYDALDSSEGNVWTLLYQTGYLTKTAGTESDADNKIELRIPNQEIKQVFNDSIILWISNTFKKIDLSQFFASFWSCDEKTLTESLSNIILPSTSCFDAYKEYFYHAYLDCLFTTYSYKILSNYESGHGFADIIVKDKTNHRAAVIEIKRTKNIAELANLPDYALNQIRNNKYDTQIDDRFSTILYWGIAFCQKHCVAKGITVRR